MGALDPGRGGGGINSKRNKLKQTEKLKKVVSGLNFETEEEARLFLDTYRDRLF